MRIDGFCPDCKKLISFSIEEVIPENTVVDPLARQEKYFGPTKLEVGVRNAKGPSVVSCLWLTSRALLKVFYSWASTKSWRSLDELD